MVVVAVMQGHHVPDLVKRLFEQAFFEERGVGKQSIEILTQPAVRDETAASAGLCLAENERENRNIEINRRNAEDMVGRPRDESLDDPRRMELTSPGMQSEPGVEVGDPIDAARYADLVLDSTGKAIEEIERGPTDWEKSDPSHCFSYRSRDQPYCFSLLWRVTRSISRIFAALV